MTEEYVQDLALQKLLACLKWLKKDIMRPKRWFQRLVCSSRILVGRSGVRKRKGSLWRCSAKSSSLTAKARKTQHSVHATASIAAQNPWALSNYRQPKPSGTGFPYPAQAAAEARRILLCKILHLPEKEDGYSQSSAVKYVWYRS